MICVLVLFPYFFHVHYFKFPYGDVILCVMTMRRDISPVACSPEWGYYYYMPLA
jgi:hypothetical protein